jgi:acetoacetate decarboxylase
VGATAFAMPLTNPEAIRPYRFIDREYFIDRYRTDPKLLRRIMQSRLLSAPNTL